MIVSHAHACERSIRAALLLRPEALVVGEVPDLAPGPGEVRVAVGGVVALAATWPSTTAPGPRPPTPGSWVTRRSGPSTPLAKACRSRGGRAGGGRAEHPCRAWCVPPPRGRTSTCEDRRSLGMNVQGALAEQVVVRRRTRGQRPGGRPGPRLHRTDDRGRVRPAAAGRPVALRALVLGAVAALFDGPRPRDVRRRPRREPRSGRFARTFGALALDDPAPIDAELVVDTVGTAQTMAMAVRHARRSAGHPGAGAGAVIVRADGPGAGPAGARGPRFAHLRPRGFRQHRRPGGPRPGHAGPGPDRRVPLEEVGRAFADGAAAPGKSWFRMGRHDVDPRRADRPAGRAV